MQKGSLHQILMQKQESLTSTQKYISILGIALGVKYLHSQSIMHCNLNPNNIFLDEHYHPFIADFGLSQISKRKFIKCESSIYLAPEILEGKEYDCKVDVYSYALIVYFVYTKLEPTVDGPSYKKVENIINGQRPDLSPVKDQSIKSLLLKCWSKKSVDRPTFKQIVNTLTDQIFYSELGIDYSSVTDYLQQFDLNQEQENQADDSKIELKAMKVCGENCQLQLGQTSNNQTSDKKQIICPSVTSDLDINSLLSISSYQNATVIINKDEKMEMIGSNSGGQVTKSIVCAPYKEFKKFNLSANDHYYTPISSVCGTIYTLYIGRDSKGKRVLVYCTSKTRRNENYELWIGQSNPEALFGGCKNAAVIDQNGGIIFVSENIISDIHSKKEPAFLPNGEKAVFVACCNDSIFVLSKNGCVYKSSAKMKLSFHPVDELKEINIVQLSGTCNHCLAVSQDGKVFGRGLNDSGCIGIGDESDNIDEFTLIESLSEYNIVNVYAGSSHSFFQTKEGKLLSCGKNKFGQLFLDDLSKDEVLSPVETTIKSGASFCIAGANISFVFINGFPPNCPNQKVDFDE